MKDIGNIQNKFGRELEWMATNPDNAKSGGFASFQKNIKKYFQESV